MYSDRDGLSAYQDPAFVANALFPAGLVYPFWHLLAPSGTVDPWASWIFVGACFASVRPLAFLSSFVREHVTYFSTGCLCLSALQLFTLAHWNDMDPFYAAGSVMSGVFCPVVIGSKPMLRVFTCWILGLALLSIAIEPSAIKAAYWLPLSLLLSFYHQRLSLQVAAADLEESNRRELEARVEARTRELTDTNAKLHRTLEERGLLEEQLRTAQRMEAVGRLAGGIAHDFNSTLTTIQGYTDLLIGAGVDGQARRDIEQIQRACDRASSLTNHLLIFSRGRIPETTVLELDAVISGMAEMMRTVLGDDLDLRLSLDSSHCRVQANRTQLEQIVMNLALNSRQAMPRGGTLTIETVEVRRDLLDSDELFNVLRRDAYVLLAVSDDGVGMDAATRSRVFEPFFTTKDIGDGTGLGLSVVYGIVRQAGGHIRVSSEYGKGSRFELYWPRVDEKAELVQPVERVEIPEGASERILLVDDDVDVRRPTVRLLRGLGYEVVEASDGEEALSRVDGAGPFDLVLSDVSMPRRDGVELVRQLSRTHPDLPLLLMAGNFDHPSIPAQSSGAAADEIAVLAKPFTLEQLATSVRRALDPNAH